jgi:hypothetical protein
MEQEAGKSICNLSAAKRFPFVPWRLVRQQRNQHALFESQSQRSDER